MLARGACEVSAADRDYLVTAVMRMFAVARGAMDQASVKDVSMRTMCVPILYTLMRGLVGIVETSSATGRITDRRVVAQRHEAALPEPSPGAVLRRYTFAPAHPGLARLLPDDARIPDMPEWTHELEALMKRTRRLNNCFLRAMSRDGARPETLCLEHARPDLLLDT
jgi:hypothetical protein